MLAIIQSHSKSSFSETKCGEIRYLADLSMGCHSIDHLLTKLGFSFTDLDPRDCEIPLAPLEPSRNVAEWRSDRPPQIAQSAKGLRLTRTDDFLFGTIRLPADRIEQATREAYQAILQSLRQYSGFQLIRVWNYIPDINRLEDGIERYRLFSKARHEVFAQSGYRMSSDLPAASAVGSQEGPLVIQFLAGIGNVTAVENPRQVSAYQYPELYGPRSPSFSRAVIHARDGVQQLFLSGTASIVGHKTVAPSNPLLQTRVTLDNLASLLEHAKYPPLASMGVNASWVVYVRNPADYPLIHPLIHDQLNQQSNIVYLQGDICRSDLCVEIEGTILC